MLVTDLQVMEKIVDSRKDLSWIGWDVVKYTKSNNAMFSPEGVYKDGQWFKKVVFPITENGWNIPSSIGQLNEKLEG